MCSMKITMFCLFLLCSILFYSFSVLQFLLVPVLSFYQKTDFPCWWNFLRPGDFHFVTLSLYHQLFCGYKLQVNLSGKSSSSLQTSVLRTPMVAMILMFASAMEDSLHDMIPHSSSICPETLKRKSLWLQRLRAVSVKSSGPYTKQ